MVRIGLPDNMPQGLLRDFPKEDVEIIRLSDQLDHDVEVEFWIPPMFGWLATPMFPHLRGVKVVQSLLAGVDWILPWLPKDIVLCDGQGLHNIPVAEYVIGAILSSLKRFPEFRDRQREQLWDGQTLPGLFPAEKDGGNSQHAGGDWNGEPLPYRILGDELAKKKVLIVGYGAIGAEVERLIQAFDVEVLRVARTAKEGVSAISDLENMLPEADIVVLLVPLTPETRGLMNAKTLAQMKPGALLVNAARGPVVDTDALLAQLNAGHIHAVLDVMDPEPLPKGHPLWSAPNCFITPHVGGSVAGFATRGYEFAAAQVRRYLAGEPLHNRVNNAGY
jgi:phosphoglycerate dehydrogenase-like enzyme